MSLERLTNVLAYAAGIVDGEGCFHITCGKDNRYAGISYTARLTVVNTDPALVQWLRDQFGGNISVHRPEGHRTKYTWQLGGSEAEQFVRLIQPYLIVKVTQAEILLRFRSIVSNNTRRLSEEDLSKRKGLYEEMKAANQARWEDICDV